MGWVENYEPETRYIYLIIKRLYQELSLCKDE